LEKLGILLPNLLWYAVNFAIMLFLLNRLLYKPILSMFAERQERIRSGLEEADSVREQAAAERARLEAQIDEERRSSQEKLRDAVSRSEEAAKRRLEEANTEAETIVTRARAEADQIRSQALSGLQTEIADLTVRAASKVLESEVDESRHRQMIARFLSDQLGELA
jgi:F-type H+-transporting ATPase subunit b